MTPRPLCLIVSADAAASGDWRRGLEPWGFRPVAVTHLAAALGVLDRCRFDAVLVDGDAEDRAVPDGPAASPLLRALPALHARTAAPILVVWSERGDAPQIDALARGAAETVVKPASPRLLGAKLKRLVEIAQPGVRPGTDLPDAATVAPPARASRRAEATPVPAEVAAVVAYGPLRLDPGRALASCAGRPMVLTAGEFELVALLAKRAGEVVSREAMVRRLSEGVPGAGRAARRETHRCIDMHVCRIRRKLDAAGADAHGVRLATVHGRGYAFRVAADG